MLGCQSISQHGAQKEERNRVLGGESVKHHPGQILICQKVSLRPRRGELPKVSGAELTLLALGPVSLTGTLSVSPRAVSAAAPGKGLGTHMLASSGRRDSEQEIPENSAR